MLALGAPRVAVPEVPPARTIIETTIALTQRHHFLFARDLPEPVTAAWDTAKSVALAASDRVLPDGDVVYLANEMLRALGTSHTALYWRGQQTFWALRNIFSGELDSFPMPQIGAWFRAMDGRWFVTDVYAGSAAEAAGLRRGDEVVLADNAPFQPVMSLDRDSVSLWVVTAADSAPRSIDVRPTRLGVQRMMLNGAERSVRIIADGCARIGYLHLPTGTHTAFLQTLTAAAERFEREATAMVLDMRGGFGGAGPDYAALFLDRGLFTKPLVVLIDRGTRSGKEWVAHLLRESGRATLIGTRTAGAFLGGSVFPIGDRFLLSLAVLARAPDGTELEGIGVPPHIQIDRPLAHSGGADPQLEAALAHLRGVC